MVVVVVFNFRRNICQFCIGYTLNIFVYFFMRQKYFLENEKIQTNKQKTSDKDCFSQQKNSTWPVE